jgi:hypothetical protein
LSNGGAWKGSVLGLRNGLLALTCVPAAGALAVLVAADVFAPVSADGSDDWEQPARASETASTSRR